MNVTIYRFEEKCREALEEVHKNVHDSDNPCETTPYYWDCECEENYIHFKHDEFKCEKCGTFHDEQPDSRINEVKAMLLKRDKVTA